MRLSRIYTDQPLVIDNKIVLNQDTVHYVRHVLRLKTGAMVVLFNGYHDSEYHCQLEFVGKQAIAHIVTPCATIAESPLDSEIIIGLSHRIDLSIQKCTELGINRIILFNAEYTQRPLKPDQVEKRLIHWQAIAIKACEQCGRHQLPVIQFFASFNALPDYSRAQKNKLLLTFSGIPLLKLLTQNNKQTQVTLLIGPEGGLSPKEINALEQKGFVSATLGPRTLRTETAAMTAIALVQSVWGDLNGQVVSPYL